MYKFCLTLLPVIFFVFTSYAQKDSLSKADKAALDSMLKNDAFLSLMKGAKKNSLDVSFGVGNGSFSKHNQAVNATGITNQVIFTPSVIYRVKGGFSVGVTGYLATDSGSMDLYQTGLSASYDYLGKKTNAGVSFTRYLSDQSKYNSKSLYQNDFYGYVKKAKGIIQPVLAVGYSNGKFKEVDTLTVIGIVRNDSTNNTTSYFYTSLGIAHDVSYYKVFSNKDELDIVPTLAINAGSDNISTTHTNKGLPIRAKRVLNRRSRVAATNKFQLQSIAASLDMTYTTGKFFIQPNIYLDYYLPSTTAKRLSAIYSLTAGFSF